MLPRSVYEDLSPAGQRIAAGIACAGEEVEVQWAPDWDVETGQGGGGEANARHKGLEVGRL